MNMSLGKRAVLLAATLLPFASLAQAPTSLGCYKDTDTFDLGGYLERSPQNTPQRCISICKAKGFAYAGVQFGESCQCGDSYGRYGAANNCDYPCTGDSGQICGGYHANNVYPTGAVSGGSPPTVVIPGGAAPTPTGADLPMPPYGTPEPAPDVQGMTLQGSQRRVRPDEVVSAPFFLINGANLANMNFEVLYNVDVIKAEGPIAKGNLLDNALLSSNPNVGGLIRAGFAQTTGVSGTGTVMNVPFRAVGKPGDSTRLHLVVTTINTPDGTQPTIYRIPGEIAIVDEDGRFPPGAGGGGPGTGGPGPGGPGTGGPVGGGPGPGSLTNGDCDGDGRLTEFDALCALKMSVQLEPVRLALDMDDNKDVTSRDATLILQRAVGR